MAQEEELVLRVRREHAHVRVVAGELAKDALVLDAQPIVERDERLERAEAGRTTRRSRHFFVVEVGVARVEEVAVSVAHGDGHVPAGVPDGGDEEHVVGEGAHRAEATPRVALERVPLPLRTVRELQRAVAAALRERGADRRRVVLRLVDVHGRVGEIREASGVVEVEVRDDDVAHVSPIEAEAFDVGERGLLEVEPRARHAEEESPEALSWRADVVRAEARVDQHEAVGALDEQAVRDEPLGRERPPERAARERAHGAAVEVVNGGHGRLFEGRDEPSRAVPELPFPPVFVLVFAPAFAFTFALVFAGLSRVVDDVWARRATGAASPCACSWSWS